MKKLQLVNLEATDNIISTECWEAVNQYSPATAIFTDFKDNKALVIDGETLATTALQMMMSSHVRMKIVVSKQDDFLGIIGTNELSEQYIMSKLSKSTGRDEVLVKDLMIPKYRLQSFEYNELQSANVGDVVSTLAHDTHRHCLVLDRAKHEIRGVISASDVARKLRINANIHNEYSFSSLYRDLQKHADYAAPYVDQRHEIMA